MKYYFVYYMNLMFSALSPDDQKIVIDKCLDPLLNLSERGFKFAIQISGVSLEIIDKYRPDLTAKLKLLVNKKQIDFIGNGYTQIIQPLFPHALNSKNQQLGQEIYLEKLGYKPNIATVNEMAFSEGSCESMIENGYSTILMEWNNPQSIKKHKIGSQFYPAKLKISNKETTLLWCDTITFQKFQKYVHGEIELKEYLQWLDDYTRGEKGTLCLYCSDAEIFNFRPARYGTELVSKLNEWDRIESLMFELKGSTIFPSDVPEKSKKIIKITNAKNPIVVKKQEKYNINRWSLSGRDDQNLNSFCYKLLNVISTKKLGFPNEEWKNLLKIASSDLRTHIEDSRWNIAKNIRNNFEKKYANYFKNDASNHEQENKDILLDNKRGNNIISWPKTNPLIGSVLSGNFSKVDLMADFYSGFVVVEKLGHRKISDLDYEASYENSNHSNKFINPQGYKIKKTIFNTDRNSLNLEIDLQTPKRTREQIKICNFCLKSDNWDIETLFYKTKLGGNSAEKFYFGLESFNQNEILNLNVVGKYGFIPTDGILEIGDKNKSLFFDLNSNDCFYLVRFSFEIDQNKRFLLQVSFITQDIDETFRESDAVQNFNFKCSVSNNL